MTHFEIWLRSYRNTVNPAIDEEEARRAYDEHYSCNCTSCVTRKASGLQPIRQTPGCTAPLEPLRETVRVAG